MEKLSLRIFGFLGIAIFIPLFLLTFVDPHLIEKSAKSFIEWKLRQKTNEKIESFNLPPETKLERMLGAKAAEMRAETEQKLAFVKQQLKADAPAMLAEQLAKLRNLDCECRKKWEDKLRLSLETQMLSLETAKARLIDFSHAKYMDIVQKLTLDVRIFFGANAVVFLLLLLVSFTKPVAMRHLFLPGTLLFISSLVCSFFYIFEQNWFYTIIYNDYTGFAYIGYLLVVFSFLCDIVMNRARVTTEIMNAILQSIGQIGDFVPC